MHAAGEGAHDTTMATQQHGAAVTIDDPIGDAYARVFLCLSRAPFVECLWWARAQRVD